MVVSRWRPYPAVDGLLHGTYYFFFDIRSHAWLLICAGVCCLICWAFRLQCPDAAERWRLGPVVEFWTQKSHFNTNLITCSSRSSPMHDSWSELMYLLSWLGISLAEPNASECQSANITKRWYYFAAQWHFGHVLQSNIIFCDICCFRSASGGGRP